jgi:hypothetical protein
VAGFFPDNPPLFYTVPVSLHDHEAIRRLLIRAGFERVQHEVVERVELAVGMPQELGEIRQAAAVLQARLRPIERHRPVLGVLGLSQALTATASIKANEPDSKPQNNQDKETTLIKK